MVHTDASAEEKAWRNLRQQQFEAYLPRYRKRRRHARRVEEVIRPLFPRYLFVRLNDEQPWRPINGTLGVRYIVCRGDRPARLPDDIVNEIKAREDEDGLVRLEPSRFARGAKVRLLAGPFADHVGLFEEMLDQDRVILLLDLLGRPVRVRALIDVVAAEA